ncbi:MAG: Holliday junction resolvase RuvX [Rickettsiaceae bacterium]|nr:Holliday junction resolvase RuvX [Rickettsiaceae bacterium]
MIYKDLAQLNQLLTNKGRLLGLDIGTKTIGVAVCDGSWLIANPKLTISRKGGEWDFAQIKKLIDENAIKAIIIGLPLNMDDSESEISKLVRKFADNLDQFLGDFKLAFFDERLSSFAAREIMHNSKTKNHRRKSLVDQIAASIILQGAIDELNSFSDK